jgi:hypothetical protein
LLSHGRWFSPGTPASSTTKTGHDDIAEILLKVALNIIKSNQIYSAGNSTFLYFMEARNKTSEKYLQIATFSPPELLVCPLQTINI